MLYGRCIIIVSIYACLLDGNTFISLNIDFNTI